MYTNAGATPTCTPAPGAPDATALAKSMAAAFVRFIFQLPAINGTLAISLFSKLSSLDVYSLGGLDEFFLADRGDLLQLAHQFFERFRQQRLRPVALRFAGAVVHLDDDSVRARRHSRQRERGDVVALPRRVRRVDDDR